MPRPKTREEPGRMIHVRLGLDIHKRLRIRVAEKDTSIQDWVAKLVIRELDKPSKKQRKS